MPVYNVEAAFLTEAIESVRQQTYTHWELCIADDASSEPHVQTILNQYSAVDERVRVTFRQQSGHISEASNSALELASGDFVLFLDHDDRLTPDALTAIADVIVAHPTVDFLYSDEDKLGFDGRRIEPFFKPAWSPVLLTSCNYITHLAAIRRSLVLALGGLRSETVGSQDHDLFLRVSEHARAVAHIPRVLYSWRMTPTSTAAASSAKPYAIAAARHALKETIERRGLDAELQETHLNGLFVIRHQIRVPLAISLVVQGNAAAWQELLQSEDITIRDAVWLPDRVVEGPGPIPTSIPILPTITDLTGDYLLWIDARHRPAHPHTVASLLEQLADDRNAVVGGVTTHRARSILQAGIMIADGGQPRYAFAGQSTLPQRSFYLNLKDLVREVAAVYSGCCAMRRETWRDLEEETSELSMSLAIIDLCLRAYCQGYNNICTPLANFETDQALPPLPSVTACPWGWGDFADPFSNPNLNPYSGDGLPFRCRDNPHPRVRYLTPDTNGVTGLRDRNARDFPDAERL